MKKALPHAGARIVSFCLLLTLAATLASEAYGQANTLWPTFRHDVQRTGRSASAGPSFPDPLWERNLQGFAYASPAFGPGGIVYAASERALYAFDRGGAPQWRFEFQTTQSATIDIRGIVSSPTVTSGGAIYIGSLDENLYRIEGDGTLGWSRDTGGQIFSSPLVIEPTGTVFVGSRSGNLFAFDAQGNALWSPFATAGEIFASPAFDNGILYVGATDGNLYAVNSATGAPAWQQPLSVGSEFVSSPAVANGVVYAGALNDRLYAVNAATGQLLWQFDTGGDIVSSPAVGSDGTVYVATLAGALFAVDGATGQARWTQPFAAAGEVASSPAIDSDGRIYIGALDGTFYCLRDTGTAAAVAWTLDAGSPVWSSPAIGTGNTLYFVSSGLNNDRGLLHAVGPSAFDVTFQEIPTAGEDAVMTVNLAGTATGAAGTLFYRSSGAAGFASLPFAGEATIPGTAITERGLQYYIVDDEGVTYPASTPQQRPANQTVRVASAGPAFDLVPRAYRMISVPLVLNDASLQGLLEDDYGAYDPQNWRLLRWKDDDFVEYPALDDAVTPGAAFFLVTRDGTPFDAESAFSVSTALPYPVVLEPGWNMVGHPFAFPVLWSDVDRDADVVTAIAYFNGAEMVQDPVVVDRLQPWEGLFVFNASDAATTIYIPPIPAPAEATPEENVAKHAGGTAYARITARLGDAQDSQNWIGIGTAAARMPEAPPFEAGIRLSIEDGGRPLAVSVAPAGQAGFAWSLTLRAQPTHDGEATLVFEGLDAAFEGMNVVVIDDDFGFARTVEDGTVRIAMPGSRPERRLRLVAGGTAFLDDALADVPVAPARTTLAPNFPNPFAGTTTIAYELADPADVELTIYNSLGQEVETLVRGNQLPGRHAVTWHGHDAASGVYLYRLRAGNVVHTGTMTRIR